VVSSVDSFSDNGRAAAIGFLMTSSPTEGASGVTIRKYSAGKAIPPTESLADCVPDSGTVRGVTQTLRPNSSTPPTDTIFLTATSCVALVDVRVRGNTVSLLTQLSPAYEKWIVRGIIAMILETAMILHVPISNEPHGC